MTRKSLRRRVKTPEWWHKYTTEEDKKIILSAFSHEGSCLCDVCNFAWQKLGDYTAAFHKEKKPRTLALLKKGRKQ